MLPTSAGVEPATSWSPVGRRIQLSNWATEAAHNFFTYLNEDESLASPFVSAELNTLYKEWPLREMNTHTQR